jgi:signal transduction histidine kinase
MPESWTEFFSSAFFMPHGHCYLWKPALVWLQVAANGIIAVSYVAISATLALLVYRTRDEIPFRMMYLAFGAFIVLCGVTHLLDIYVIWRPAYWIDGSVRAVTALMSAGTALLLPPLVPAARTLARGGKALRERGIELETAVRDLETMYQKTKELEQLKSQFFANVSHELRTPLALIMGPIDKLLASPDLTAGQRSDLQLVIRNARTLRKHVDDLLDASKLEAGKMVPDYVASDLALLVRGIASSFEALAAERRIELSIQAPDSLAAEIDPDKVSRVVLNLLSNAFKVTPSGGRIRCAVAVSAGDGGARPTSARRATISVADSGPGIRPDHRLAVFERFRQLDGGPTRRVAGTGLGLAIAKDFVELHGGRISIADAPEGGALFVVELPLEAPAGSKVAPALPQPDHTQAESAREALEQLRARVEAVPSIKSKGKPLVLVVEDNPDMSRFLADSLAAEFRTEAAFDGQAGLDAAIALKPDLVLTDVMMPGLSGDDLVRRLRGHPGLLDVPIVLLTAKADDDLRVQMLQEGAQDYLTKPFSADELRARVRNLVTFKRAQDVLREAKASAEASAQELEAFSYSVSHDLRAPLRSIDGFSQVLLDDYGATLDETGQGYVKRVRAAAQRMSELIDDLLDLSRLSQVELSRAPVRLSEIAKAVAEELRQREPERQVIFAIQDGLAVEGDPRLLRVLLENLFSNAWKFTSKVADARIEFGTQIDDSGRHYFVRDNGAGFPTEHTAKLFAPFKRLHDEGEFPGTGIGLATVSRIVGRHGGRVWAEGSVGRGATIRFAIPGTQEGAGR